MLLDWLLISSCIHCWTLCTNVYAVTGPWHKIGDMGSQLYVSPCTMTTSRCDVDVFDPQRHAYVILWRRWHQGMVQLRCVLMRGVQMINANVTHTFHNLESTELPLSRAKRLLLAMVS